MGILSCAGIQWTECRTGVIIVSVSQEKQTSLADSNINSVAVNRKSMNSFMNISATQEGFDLCKEKMTARVYVCRRIQMICKQVGDIKHCSLTQQTNATCTEKIA